MTTAELLDQGRESFERQAWADAYARLSEADQQARWRRRISSGWRPPHIW